MNTPLNPNKIFMFSSVHFWQDTRIFFKEARSLSNNDWLVDFFAVGPTGKYEKSYEKNLNIHQLPKNKTKFRFHQWYFLLKKALECDSKYYHFHDPELLIVSWRIKKRKPDAVIIYDMHENVPKQLLSKDWIPKLLRRPVSFLFKRTEKFLLRYCDQVIFAETSYKDDYNYLTAKATDILNYPLTVADCPNYKKEKEQVLIYVGDIVEDRNIFGMIEIVHRLKKDFACTCRLKLIGPIEMKLKTKVVNLIEEYELTDSVDWFGRLPYDEIWTHYFQADIGLCLLQPMPNYQNSLATKLFEYMAAGLPIVASNFPDWEKLLNRTNSGISVDPLNTQQVAEEVFQLLNDSERLESYGRSGRRAFDEEFSWSNEERKLLSIYDKGKKMNGKC